MIPINSIYEILLAYYGKQNWWPADSDLEMMLGAILVQHTNWQNAAKSLAMCAPFEGPALLALSESEWQQRIRPAGSFVRKAQTILALLNWFAQYQFDTAALRAIPTHQLRSELLAIKGIGPETADCILLYACNRPVFVVDSYLKRLLAHTQHCVAPQYDAIQNYMVASLPSDVLLFQEYHALIVAYGKDFLSKKHPIEQHDPLAISPHN